MADGIVQVPPDSTGKIIDASELTVNAKTVERQRVVLADSTGATYLATVTYAGSLLVSSPTEWTIVNAAAVNTAATVTKAAGAAGVKHVLTSITASLASDGTGMTVPASPVNVVVRDGATGAGTIIWEAVIGCPATAGDSRTIALSGLSIVGSAATAMCIEFTAAGGAHSFQTISGTGYDTK